MNSNDRMILAVHAEVDDATFLAADGPDRAMVRIKFVLQDGPNATPTHAHPIALTAEAATDLAAMLLRAANQAMAKLAPGGSAA